MQVNETLSMQGMRLSFYPLQFGCGGAALDQKRKWIFLIEVVTSHGPMNPKRIYELEELFKNYRKGLVFVTAFPNFTEFKRHSNDISWETEAWLADFPDHMIHYNGDKFPGPR